MNVRIKVLLLASVIMAVCLLGCSRKNDVPSRETAEISITVINKSDVDAGMFSIINPFAGDQINVGAVASNESITIDMEWPVDDKEIKWALYNKKGELCLDAVTDISEAKGKVTLLMSGKGTIDNIEALF